MTHGQAYAEVLAPNHYHDRYFGIEAAKILPGEYYATGRDMMRVTVLGFTVTSDGVRDSEFVRGYLEREHIRLMAEDMLDIFPRKVHFFPGTGRIPVKKLKKAHNNTSAERETEYSGRLKSANLAGEVELFI